jgi:hypothetical protein
MNETERREMPDENFYYFEKTETCGRHYGVKVTYETSKYNECPLCSALGKLAERETEIK